MKSYSWRVRPDCREPGCTEEAANKLGWCIKHHPRRCVAQVTESAAARADGDSRCRTIAKKGHDRCWRHINISSGEVEDTP